MADLHIKVTHTSFPAVPAEIISHKHYCYAPPMELYVACYTSPSVLLFQKPSARATAAPHLVADEHTIQATLAPPLGRCSLT